MTCKWGNKPPYLINSSAWLCMYKIPVSLVFEIGKVNYEDMEINESLCTPMNCRCYEDK